MQPDELAQHVVAVVRSVIGPLAERVAAAEARLQMLGDVRDRVVTLETKQPATHGQPASAPALAELTTVRESVTALTERLRGVEQQCEAFIGDWSQLDTRLGNVETAEPPEDLTAQTRLTFLEGAVTTLRDDSIHLRERVAALDARAPVPGPAGPMGPAGTPGKDGRDGVHGTNGSDGTPGADGVGFDDLAVEFDGQRTIALKFQRGLQVRTFPLVLPFLRYLGVYQQGKAYEPGDCVTWAGQLWHCHETTIAPPGDGSKLWQLCVRKGRDGKDGKAAATLPVIVTGTTTGTTV